jgi:hypothetical protein
VRNRHAAWLETVAPADRVDALCELNVVEQALNVCQTTVVQEAWQRGQEIVVHGWVYRLHNGLLKDLTMTVSRLDDAVVAYDAAIAAVHARYADRPRSPPRVAEPARRRWNACAKASPHGAAGAASPEPASPARPPVSSER